jgi:hypothetical protein
MILMCRSWLGSLFEAVVRFITPYIYIFQSGVMMAQVQGFGQIPGWGEGISEASSWTAYRMGENICQLFTNRELLSRIYEELKN